MVYPSRPPLPPNRPYCQPFNYYEYDKNSIPNAHVKVFKIAIITNNETNDAKNVQFYLQRYCV